LGEDKNGRVLPLISGKEISGIGRPKEVVAIDFDEVKGGLSLGLRILNLGKRSFLLKKEAS
jgi:hypothetical protein